MFFVLLGQTTSGQGRAFAFVGAAALVLTLPTSILISQVPMTDKWMGTFHRIRLGRMPTVAIFALRAIPWLVEAAIMLVVSIAVIGALTGQLKLAAMLLALTPVFLLMAVTNAAAGLAVACFAVGRRAHVVLGNALMYLTIAAGGVVVPVGRIPWLDDIGRVLPLRNGILAVRAILAGQPWGTHLQLEVVVGAGWGLLAVAAVNYQIRQARRKGLDAYA